MLLQNKVASCWNFDDNRARWPPAAVIIIIIAGRPSSAADLGPGGMAEELLLASKSDAQHTANQQLQLSVHLTWGGPPAPARLVRAGTH